LHYLAMQYVDGVDLRQMLASQGKLPVSVAAEITRQIGSALDAAHANGLIHRDVKPANILITGAGAATHAYLSDFGVSRQLAALSDLTLPGSVVGTPDYSSPEQHLGRRVDLRSDVYSLGCVLYEMLTGDKPFDGDSVTAVAIAHCEQPTPLVRDIDPELAAAFDPVVAKAMAKHPDERYQSAGELGAAATAASRESLTPEAEVGVDQMAITNDTATRIRLPGENEVPTRIVAPDSTDDTATRIVVPDEADAETPDRIAPQATPVPTVSPVARVESPISMPSPSHDADANPAGRQRPRRRRWFGLAILALIAAAVAIGIVVTRHGGTAISAKVISPIGANVRSTAAREGHRNFIHHLRLGNHVTVSCNVTGTGAAIGWDRLHSPYPGRYVAADLLKPQSPVPRCS
jgi:serine/threonine protein kinase